MAKPKTEPTEAQKAYKTASEVHKKAKEANAKNDNEATKKALEKAVAHLKSVKVTKNRESFIRVGNGRIDAAIKALNGLGKLASPTSYEYGETDVATIKMLVGDAFKSAMAAFEMSKTKQAKVAAVKATFLQ